MQSQGVPFPRRCSSAEFGSPPSLNRASTTRPSDQQIPKGEAIRGVSYQPYPHLNLEQLLLAHLRVIMWVKDMESSDSFFQRITPEKAPRVDQSQCLINRTL